MTFLSMGVEEEGARVICEVGREKLRETELEGRWVTMKNSSRQDSWDPSLPLETALPSNASLGPGFL